MDEPAAIAAGSDAIAAGKGPLDLYGSAKHALNCWCRRVAGKPEWAGAGIPLNVVAPGFIDTPAAAYILSDPERSAAAGRMVPMRGAYPGSSRADGRHPCLVREPGKFADDGTNPFCRWWF